MRLLSLIRWGRASMREGRQRPCSRVHAVGPNIRARRMITSTFTVHTLGQSIHARMMNTSMLPVHTVGPSIQSKGSQHRTSSPKDQNTEGIPFGQRTFLEFRALANWRLLNQECAVNCMLSGFRNVPQTQGRQVSHLPCVTVLRMLPHT